MTITNQTLIEILKRIATNAHITRAMIEDGKVIHAHRKNDAVIDQISLLMTKLAQPDVEVAETEASAVA